MGVSVGAATGDAGPDLVGGALLGVAGSSPAAGERGTGGRGEAWCVLVLPLPLPVQLLLLVLVWLLVWLLSLTLRLPSLLHSRLEPLRSSFSDELVTVAGRERQIERKRECY